MKKANKKIAWALLATTVVATAAVAQKASAELVLESDLNQPAYQADTARGADREGLRQVLDSSRKAEITLQQQPVIVQQQAPMAQIAQAQPDVNNMSRSEMVRRARVREELKNEDVLQEKLEALRLQDEQRRTAEVMALAQKADLNAQAQPVAQPAQPVMTGSEVVVAPIADRGAQPAATPSAATAPVAAPNASNAQVVVTSPSSSEQTSIRFAPRIGVGGVLGANSANINSRYAAGMGVEVGVSDNVGVEAGYTYGEYGAKSIYSSPIVQQYQFYQGGQQIAQPLTAKQNLFDAGVKLYFLGSESKIRPFVGGGAAYSRTYANYDQAILDRMSQMGLGNMTEDYEINSFMGQVSTGLDLRISKNVSVGAVFKFYNTLSATSNQPNTGTGTNAGLYNPYLTNPYGGYNNYYPVNNYSNAGFDQDRRDLANSLLKNNFYVMQMGVSFGF